MALELTGLSNHIGTDNAVLSALSAAPWTAP